MVLFCVGFRVLSIRDAGRRAAHLSLINLIPAYGGPHLSFLADVFGVSLSAFRLIHRSAGAMSLPLLIFHVGVSIATRTPFPLRAAENMWGLVGACSLGCLLLLCLPICRRPSYEVFLRLHQALAVLCLLSIWCHLRSGPVFPRLSISILFITFATILLLQFAHLVYHNKAMGTGLSQAYVTCDGDTVKIRLRLSRRVKVEPGQYTGLWIPAISFRSSLQSHPFAVTSWSQGKQQYLDMLIEPRNGLMRTLLDIGRANMKTLGEQKGRETREGGIALDGIPSHLALFTGPHGRTAPVSEYETVVMIASGYGSVTATVPSSGPDKLRSGIR